MPTKPFSGDDYHREFRGDPQKLKAALERALDIRKFEIELYWKRAAYFWTINAAALAGFVAIQVAKIEDKIDISVLVACLGLVFSFGWLCVNRGSKHWQENWEYHVDMLEDAVVGPLYKVVMKRSDPKGLKEWSVDLLTGPSPLSVSKINQLISLFVTLLWVRLLVYSLRPLDPSAPWDNFHVFLVGLAIAACIAFVTLGRTYEGGYWHQATIRTASIRNDA